MIFTDKCHKPLQRQELWTNARSMILWPFCSILTYTSSNNHNVESQPFSWISHPKDGFRVDFIALLRFWCCMHSWYWFQQGVTLRYSLNVLFGFSIYHQISYYIKKRKKLLDWMSKSQYYKPCLYVIKECIEKSMNNVKILQIIQ